MERRIWFQEGVFAGFRKCKPDVPTKLKIREELKTLVENPERGVQVPYEGTLFYRLSIGDYRVHYIFDDHQVRILYLGIPGSC